MSDAGEQPALGSSRDRVKRLFKNTGIYAIGEAGVKILGAILLPILALFLTPAMYGIWSLAQAMFSGLTNIANPAMHASVTRFYFDHEHEPDAQKRFQGTISSFLLIWSFSLCTIATIVGDWVFDALFDDFAFWPYGALVVWMVFIGVLGVVPKAVWIAAEKSKPFVGVSLLSNAVYLLGSIGLLALAKTGVIGLFLGRMASLIVVAVPMVIYSARHIGLAWSWDDLRSALRFSLPLVPHLLAHWALYMSDRLIITNFYDGLDPGAVPDRGGIGDSGGESLGLHAVGIYAAAYEFLMVVTLVAGAMNNAWVPLFNRAHNRPEERAFIARSITYFVLAVAAMSTGAIVLGPSIVRIFMPAKWAFAAGIAPILGLGGLFQGLYFVYVAVLFYYKANRLIPVITVISALANIGLNLLWVPSYGLAGAAWATVVGYVILVVGVRWASGRYPMPDFESKRLVRIAVVLSTVAIAGLVLDARLPLAWEAVAKLALLGVGAAALWLLGVFAPRKAKAS